MSSPSRRLTTLWFADIAGFTRLSATDETLALQVMEVMRQCVRKAVGARHGKVVKFLGDGALAEFPSAEGAVMAALEAAARFEGGTRALTGGPYQLHTGVHVGDVVDGEDGDIFGDGVNRAQRVESLGKPGQTLISEEVYRLVRRRPELSFTSLGQQTAKGLDEPFEVFLVGPLGELALRLGELEKGGEAQPVAVVAAPPAAGPRSSGPAGSAPVRRSSNSRTIGIGIAAGVTTIVLVAVWSGFRSKPDSTETRLPIPDTITALVHDSAMAMPVWPARTAAEVVRAAGPKSVADLAAAGEQYFAALGKRDLTTHEVLPTLRRALNEARDGAPRGARADAIRGIALFMLGGDAKAAERAFKASVAAAPDAGQSRVMYAQLLIALGRFDEAKMQIDAARGKKDVAPAMYDAVRGALLFRQGQFGDARGALNNSLKAEDVLSTRILLARAQLAQNKFDDARKTLEERIVAHPEIGPWMAYAQLRATQDKDKNAKPNEQMLQMARNPSSGYAGALLLLAAGQRAQALAALDRMAQANDPDLIWLAADPEWAPLRANAQFRQLTSQPISRR